MNLTANIQTDLFALCVLVLISCNLFRRIKSSLFEQKIFYMIVLTNAVMLILDALKWLLDGVPGAAAGAADIVLAAVYFPCSVLPCMLWAVYVDYHVYGSRKRIVHAFLLLFAPVIAISALSAMSCHNRMLFYFDADNVYHRGKYFWLFAAVCITYLIMTQMLILSKHRKIEKQFMLPISFFAVPPILGTVIQSCFFGISLVWPCMTLSVLLIFLNIQSGQLYIDHLTGLYNRRHLDYFLNERINSKNRNTVPAGIMIDLNSFKSINDNFGHAIGDQALIDAGRVLRTSIRSSDFVCRYGGDEFVVILEIRNRGELERVVKRIRENVKLYNVKKHPKFTMSFSMGYDVFHFETGKSIKQFLCHIDSLMYLDKKLQKTGA